MKYIPKKHHKQGIEFVLTHNYGGLFAFPGSGKTGIILHSYEILKAKGLVRKMLVICTSTILDWEVWPAENKKWGLEFKMVELTGNTKFDKLKSDFDIALMTVDNWLMFFDKKVSKKGGITYTFNKIKFNKLGCEMVVLDESSKIKNYNSRRFKAYKKMLPFFDRRYILTGTPAPKNYLDLFSQLFFVDRGLALGTTITSYRNNYFRPMGFKGFQYELMPGMDVQIKNAIKPVILSISDAANDLPPLVPVPYYFDMPDKIVRMHREMKKELVAYTSGHFIKAENAGVAIGKLRQIATGVIYIDDQKKSIKQLILEGLPDRVVSKDRKHRVLHTKKIEILKEIISELQGEQVVIGYNYTHEAKEILKAFPKSKYNIDVISGATTKVQAKTISKRWSLGATQILLGQIVCVAHGLNLQESGCNKVMFYSLTYNLEDYEQFIKRVWRTGQGRHTYLYYILANNSIDADIYKNLTVKDSSQTSLLSSLTGDIIESPMFLKTQDRILLGERLKSRELGLAYSEKNSFKFITGLYGRLIVWGKKDMLRFLKGCPFVKPDLDKLSLAKLNKYFVGYIFDVLKIEYNNSGTFLAKDPVLLSTIFKRGKTYEAKTFSKASATPRKVKKRASNKKGTDKKSAVGNTKTKRKGFFD